MQDDCFAHRTATADLLRLRTTVAKLTRREHLESTKRHGGKLKGEKAAHASHGASMSHCSVTHSRHSNYSAYHMYDRPQLRDRAAEPSCAPTTASHRRAPTASPDGRTMALISLPRRPLRQGFLPYPSPLLRSRSCRSASLRLHACAAAPRPRTLAEEMQQATRERRPFRIDKSKLTQAEKRQLRLRSKSIPLVADHDPLDIVFEDDTFLVLNKPPYLKMHPSHRFEGGSLLNRAIGYLGYPPRLLHRLDMHTTGVVILAKKKQVCHPIMQQFMHGNVSKHYLCVVDGYSNQLRNTTFTVEAPIQSSSVCYVREIGDSNSDSKPAKTSFKILDESQAKQVMLLHATPHTGRTHQIRVHAASKSLPIIGDDLYNPKEHAMYDSFDEINAAARDESLSKFADGNPLRKGLKLHAWSISLVNPLTNELMSFSAPLPTHMKDFLEWCGMSPPK